MYSKAWLLRVDTIPRLVLLALACGAPVLAADIPVNDTGDALHDPGCAKTGTGTCTLRDAITFANANPGPDSIFLGGRLFRPTSSLPVITDGALTLVGLGSMGGLFPSSSTIDGSLAGPSDGLTIAADGCSISSLLIQGFKGTGIVILGSNNSIPVVVTSALAVEFHLVFASANQGRGFEIRGGAGNVLSGARAEQNGGNGIYLHAGAAGNVIAPDLNSLVYVSGNGLSGIRIGDGVSDTATQRNTIGRLMSDHGNGGLAVDLAGDCVTASDPLDTDTGPNGLQNFTLVSSASFNNDGTVLTMTGTLNSAPNATFALRFYTRFGEFVGETAVTTDGTGDVSYSLSITRLGPANESVPVLASATDAAGNTSELTPMPSVALPALAFHTTTPCRVTDTRESGGPLTSRIPRSLALAGQCGVPQTARAVVLNVTVTNPTASGHVSFPGEAPLCRPDTSTINFSAGQTRANRAVVRLDAGGLLAYPVLVGSGTVDLILDVSGYLE
jgi:CSLREA domain-containing protein